MSSPHDNDIHPSLNKLISKEESSLFYVTVRPYQLRKQQVYLKN